MRRIKSPAVTFYHCNGIKSRAFNTPAACLSCPFLRFLPGYPGQLRRSASTLTASGNNKDFVCGRILGLGTRAESSHVNHRSVIRTVDKTRFSRDGFRRGKLGRCAGGSNGTRSSAWMRGRGYLSLSLFGGLRCRRRSSWALPGRARFKRGQGLRGLSFVDGRFDGLLRTLIPMCPASA